MSLLRSLYSNGTVTSTYHIKTLKNSDAENCEFEATVAYKNLLLFVFDDGVHGHELCRSDATVDGTGLVTGLNSGKSNGVWGELHVFQDHVYFAGYSGMGGELWATDGTQQGTYQVKDIVPGEFSSNPHNMLVSGDRLFFTVYDIMDRNELWQTDGTSSGTQFLYYFPENLDIGYWYRDPEPLAVHLRPQQDLTGALQISRSTLNRVAQKEKFLQYLDDSTEKRSWITAV